MQYFDYMQLHKKLKLILIALAYFSESSSRYPSRASSSNSGWLRKTNLSGEAREAAQVTGTAWAAFSTAQFSFAASPRIPV